ncbi:BamA/OMP85 family outer membrane protein [Planctellipticum variicoloris]|uniref:BamA/OMP85 family outer membrane protein n=1 Tax=Planctellipticum variicoloris TaxID=3064265 RepID=UPI003013BF25|nr:BamA/TamA family outer membrane protein [Planctomycetaceae bacterium SH412]
MTHSACDASHSQNLVRPPNFSAWAAPLLCLFAFAANGGPAFSAPPEDFRERSQPSELAEADQSANEPEGLLAEVKIEGNSTISSEDIARQIRLRPGRPASQKLIQDDVDALVRLRWFARVEPILKQTDDGLVLTFKVLERPIVKHVEFKGNKKVKKEKFEGITNLKPGSPFDPAANKECARRIEKFYHEKGYVFAIVDLECGGEAEDRDVVFLITEGPKVAVSGFKFRGNESFNSQLLRTKLTTKPQILWLFGGKYDPTTVTDDVGAIKAYYYSLGYFDVQIEHKLAFTDDKSKVQIQYDIDEGPRYKIRKVEFNGNDVIPEPTLRSDLTISNGEFFSARKINIDVQKMLGRYGEQGRLFAKVDAVPIYLTEPGQVDLEFRIDEANPTRLREIRVHMQGDHPHTRTHLVRNIMRLHPGDLADPNLIRQSKTRIEGSGYFDHGPENGVRLEIRPVNEPDWISDTDLKLARGQSGPFTQVRVGGHTTAKPLVDADDYKAGPPVEEEEEEEEEEVRHGATGVEPVTGRLFNAPAAGSNDILPFVARGQSRGPLPEPQDFINDNSPQGNPLSDALRNPGPDDWVQPAPPDFVDIDAYLTEARTGRLMFGVGVNSNAGVVGNIVLSEDNFDILRPPTSWDDVWNGTAWRGAGQKFRIEALPGTQVSRYMVDWQDPYFLDTDYNLGVSGFYFQRFYEYWTEQRLGGRVRVGKQLTRDLSASLSVRLEDVQISNIPTFSPQDLRDVYGDNFLSTVRGSLIHDTRDAAMMPSAGHYMEFSLEQAFAEFNYFRVEAEGRQYFTTYQRPDGYGKHVLTLRGDLGWTESSTPVFERFYAGGFQNFRGFAFRGVSPTEDGIRTGGTWMALGGAEYSIPVTANEMIRVVGFTDFGTVSDQVTLDDFRLSVGGGLRIMVPMMGPVPIALDWSVPILKGDFDNTQLFSFYVGINR